MIRALYTAASGMLAGARRQLQIAHAIANLNTPGYKDGLSSTRSFNGVLLRAQGGVPGQQSRVALGTGTLLEGRGVDLREGTPAYTGGTLDVAIAGDGFFVVEGADGVQRLTRDGQFEVDAEGFLANTRGARVLSTAGTPIAVASSEAQIDPDGSVRVDGAAVATVRRVTVAPEALLRAGDSAFVVADAAALTEAAVLLSPGRVEQSNVNATQAMSEMVAVARTYESAQRVFALASQVLERTATDVGRL